MGWLVKSSAKNPEAVIIESVKYPLFYLETNISASHRLRVTNEPELDTVQWSIVKNDDNTFKIQSLPCRDPPSNTATCDPMSLMIYRPPISEHMELIFSQDNLATTQIKTTFNKVVGICTDSNESVRRYVRDELKKRLKEEGKYKRYWKESNETTWKEFKPQKILKDRHDVDPGEKKRLYQLVGKYGSYKVRSSKYFNEIPPE
jgi:hypothetical protein